MRDSPQTGAMTESEQFTSSAPAGGQGPGSQLPPVNLPKGGGAIRGMGEKFATNPVTGTASLSVPLGISPGRSGFGPELTLSYDSGAGNGPFGLGWTLSVSSITRKTDKGLPRYGDAEDSDVYLMSGAEDLVAVLQPDGQRFKDDTTAPGFVIHHYRPRIEGAFARIERWTNLATGEIHWRSISRENVTTLYGRTNDSRIFDPADANPQHPTRIFTWLVCQSYDDQGNAIVYEYSPENDDGIDRAQANERNRTRNSNRYLKGIKYGNQKPNRDPLTWKAFNPSELPADTWMFEIVFDYGEGHYSEDPPDGDGQVFALAQLPPPPDSPRPVRLDPFSTYRSSFEVRTYRLCRRVLVFHHFPEELGIDDCLVRSSDFSYEESPVATFINGITQCGYVRRPLAGRPNRYLKKSRPALQFEYSPTPNAQDLAGQRIRTIDANSLDNLPTGLHGHYRWIDLDAEGASGILTEQANGWFYKRNWSANNLSSEDGQTYTAARFSPLEVVAHKPSASLVNGSQFVDLAGDGQVDLVHLEGSVRGFYERTDDATWSPFRPFVSWPNVNSADRDLRFVDLTGDGHADILLTEGDVLTWCSSLGEDGFGQEIRVPLKVDEEKSPRVVFADATESIYLADLSGDGLSDLVRIRNGEVCYWPNLGYGHFGPKVTMDNSPWFDDPDSFDQRRIRLADIDGSGTTDILYFGHRGAQVYFNQSGNRWSARNLLPQFPPIDDIASIQTVDLLGNGTACLVWSSPLPAYSRRPLRYLPLIDEKPHLLRRVKNNLGVETEIQYAPSTKFYLDDQEAGKSWVTRLPFPVHVVERVATFDHIGHNHFVTRYAYHHGFFDGVEREFRGFGMVEQFDTEELAALSENGALSTSANLDQASHVPPVLTRTWFHTGGYLSRDHVSDYFAGLLDANDQGEYYREPGLTDAQARALLLPDTPLPTGLTADEEREACRALKGSMLRQEIYALDASGKAAHPYTVTEQNFTIECLQARNNNRYGVFYAHPREAINFHYERIPADPRIHHTLTLEVDGFGNILKAAAIGYGRRQPDEQLSAEDQATQARTLLTYTENKVTGVIDAADEYRTPLPAETLAYELTGYVASGPSGRFQATDLVQPDPGNPARFIHLFDNQIPYEQQPAGGRQRRLVEQTRTYYRKDDLTSLQALQSLEPGAIPGETYQLAFTPGLLALVYSRNGQSLLPDALAVLGGQGPDRGGYVDLDGDGRWWIPSGRVFFSPGTNDTAAQELAFARAHFFLLHRRRDPFHSDIFNTESLVTYDAHNLLTLETSDPLGNRITVGERKADGTLDPDKPGNDYRVLQPRLVMDPNRNRSEVAFDALGIVVGTAIMGKPEENLGDTLLGFDADLTDAVILAQMTNPLANPQTILQRATTRLVHDLFAYQRTQSQPEVHPAVVHTLARETHDADLEPGQPLPIQHSFSYSDGFGREIQKKGKAEPGPVPKRGANGKVITGPDGQPEMTTNAVNPCWVGSGWIVFNNKRKVVRQYEPFFTDTHQFEFDVKIGVSPVLYYDPVERLVATLHPNHTWEKVVFDAWRRETWDTSDTLLVPDPKGDLDVGNFFQRLPESEYLPSWTAFRTDPANDAAASVRWPDPKTRDAEKRSAEKAVIYAATPVVLHADGLGRTFLAVVHNKFKYSDSPTGNPPAEEFYVSRIVFDLEGNQREIVDAKKRLVMRYDYDMLRNRIHQASMEAGERWTLNDVSRKVLYGWDSRDHRFRRTYDTMRRPADYRLRAGLGPEIVVERRVYGESRSNAETNNLRGRVLQHFDQAGTVLTDDYDFKGNLLRSSRQLADVLDPQGARLAAYSNVVDWSAPVDFEVETYTTRTRYDALNRPTQLIAPHSNQPGTMINVIQPVYNAPGRLEQVHAWLNQNAAPTTALDPATANLHAVTNIDYDAKGQRTRIDHATVDGTLISTSYAYDRETSRLIHLYTRRGVDPATQQGVTFTDDCENPQPPPPGVAAPELPPQGKWCGLQNLYYTYDPAGNVSHLRDDAQQTIYFRNKRVEPEADYTYDATYRLLEATGREHLGQAGGTPISHSYNDAPRVGLPHPGDGLAMGTYLERYVYDAVGNFIQMQHRGSDPANPGWTRSYTCAEKSLLEPGSLSNRISSTVVGGATETYSTLGDGYDAHGNLLRMPHLQELQWSFNDELQMIRRQAVNASDADGVQHQGERTFYVYDVEGRRVRKVTELSSGQLKDERVYLGGFELYRRHGANPVLRETLQIMDDKQRIALVETRTQGNDAGPGQLVRYQFSNHLGSASLELDDRAQIISYEEYTPFGSSSYQAVRSQTETPKRYRYTGKERDEESGFCYHEARYYTSWLGRWTSADPAAARIPAQGSDPPGKADEAGPGYRKGESANEANERTRSSRQRENRANSTGMVDGPNLYAYARNNPIKHHDTTGRQATRPALEPPTPSPSNSTTETEKPAIGERGKKDSWWAGLLQAFAAILTFAAAIIVGALLGGVAGAAIGAIVGFTHVLISALGQDPSIRHSQAYKTFLGITSWFNPIALVATALGAAIAAVNLVTVVLTLGLWDRARFSVGFYHGMLLIEGGAIRPGRAWTNGTIIQVNPDDEGVQDPETREVILRHEWGHALNNAMFNLFQVEDPIVENFVGQESSLFERFAESNVNPNKELESGLGKDSRRLQGGRGFGEVPWWNP